MQKLKVNFHISLLINFVQKYCFSSRFNRSNHMNICIKDNKSYSNFIFTSCQSILHAFEFLYLLSCTETDIVFCFHE